mmetsp:Transcript_18904/g.18055  ORF Transcript_18904/g.18055 Transcript_18904/m.18055 type:complete len:99 (+) Transcript_18904:606-902(+)
MAEMNRRYGEAFEFSLDSTYFEESSLNSTGQLVSSYILEINEVEYIDWSDPESPVALEGFKYRSYSGHSTSQGLSTVYFRYEMSPFKLKQTIVWHSTR